MKLRLVAVVVTVAALTGQRAIQACGDKFLLPPRGMSFEDAYRASHPGSVVIYAPGTAGDAAAFDKVQTLLTRVGHRVVLVRADDQLGPALSASKADIILTNFSEAAHAGQGLSPRPIGPVILPVLSATKAQKNACKALLYPCLLESKDKPEQFVAVVNAVMNDRAKALSRKR